MSKTTKIVVVGSAFSVFCFLVLLSFSKSRPVQYSEAPVKTKQAPAPLPSTESPPSLAASSPYERPRMVNPELEESARKRNGRTSDGPREDRIPAAPMPKQRRPPAPRGRISRDDEEVLKRSLEEEIARLRERADVEKNTVGSVVHTKVGDVIDEILAGMDFGNIAFNSPGKMKLNSPTDIQLVVSPTETIEKLKESIVAEGEKHGEQIRISDTMEARLTGTAFQIGAITPELQAITGKEVTNWKWEVRPTEYGRHKLHLTLSALVTLKGSSVPRPIRTFERTIEVEVSSLQRTFLLFRENWEWMWTLVTFPVIGWWLRRRHLTNNQTAHTESLSLKTEGAVQQAATGESEPTLPSESATAPVASPVSEPEIPAGSRMQDEETETGS